MVFLAPIMMEGIYYDIPKNSTPIEEIFPHLHNQVTTI